MSKYLHISIFISVYRLCNLCYFFSRICLLRLNGQVFFQLEPIIKVATILRDTQHVIPKLGWTISPFCYLGTRLCLFVSITTGLWELRFYWCHHGYLEAIKTVHIQAAREKFAVIIRTYCASEALKAYLIVREALFWGRRGCILINPSRFLLLVLLCRFCVWRRRSRLRVSVLSFFLPAGTSPNRGHIFSGTKQPQKPEYLEKTEFPKSQTYS